MPATPSSVKRQLDLTGNDIKTYTDDSARRVQGVALDPEVMGELLTTGRTDGTPLDQQQVLATPGRLFRASITLRFPAPAGPLWLLAIDKVGAAINGDLPILRSPMFVGDFGAFDLGLYGEFFPTAIRLVVSTSPADVQLPGAGDAGFFQWARF